MNLTVEVLTESDLLSFAAGRADDAVRQRVRQGLKDDPRVAAALERIRRSSDILADRGWSAD